jgi:hypothetical protein
MAVEQIRQSVNDKMLSSRMDTKLISGLGSDATRYVARIHTLGHQSTSQQGQFSGCH